MRVYLVCACWAPRFEECPSPNEKKTKRQSTSTRKDSLHSLFPAIIFSDMEGSASCTRRKTQGLRKKHRLTSLLGPYPSSCRVTVSVVHLLGNRNNATRKSRNGKGYTIFLSFFPSSTLRVSWSLPCSSGPPLKWRIRNVKCEPQFARPHLLGCQALRRYANSIVNGP